jgi:hypothetical protein
MLIAVLLIGGGVYVYVQNQQTNQPSVVSQTTQATSTTQGGQATSTIKGWLEGQVGNWILAETTKSLSGYSGNKFALKFNDKSNCVYVYSNGNQKSFFCLSGNPLANWGYGDRVRVTGIIGTNNNVEVTNMEIVSSLPVANW